MRTIKFRGKRTDTGEWAYGSLLKFDIGYVITISEATKSDDSLDEKNSIVFSADEIASVNPDTIGQFTGLLDKNGKEIYEGDVLQDTTRKARYKVYWSKGIHAWFVEQLDYGSKAPLCCLDNNLEVIGTIHDNPKLLKGGKE